MVCTCRCKQDYERRQTLRLKKPSLADKQIPSSMCLRTLFPNLKKILACDFVNLLNATHSPEYQNPCLMNCTKVQSTTVTDLLYMLGAKHGFTQLIHGLRCVKHGSALCTTIHGIVRSIRRLHNSHRANGTELRAIRELTHAYCWVCIAVITIIVSIIKFQ